MSEYGEFDDIDKQLKAELGFGSEGEQVPEKKTPVHKVAFRWIGAAAVVAIAGGVALGVKGCVDGGPSISSTMDLAAAGHGKVGTIDMRPKPVTISTFETNVAGTKTEFEADFQAGSNIPIIGNIKVPVLQQSITRTTNVETELQLATDNLTIAWTPAKPDAKGAAKYGQLYAKVPNAALSQTSHVVVLPPPIFDAEGKPIKTKVKPTATTDTGNNAISGSAQQLQALSGLIGSTFGGGASEVPILGGISSGNMSITSGLENYSNLATQVNVGEACTKSVMAVPHFTEDLKKNVAKMTGDTLLSQNPKVEAQVDKAMPGLNQMPYGTVRSLVKNVIVLLPGETIEHPNAKTTMKVPSDAADIAQLNAYKKSSKVSMTVKQASSSKLECDASDAKLIENIEPSVEGGK